MKVDFRGRVDKLPLAASKCLLPVFEAVVNSIHAIEDRQVNNGHITIRFRRSTSQGVLHDDVKKTDPIEDFEVHDNGIGFDETNFDSFDTSDSRHKADRGGKGVGRLLWLKAFRKVVVDSVFESEGVRLRRRFDFLYSDTGIENNTTSDAPDAAIGTVVKLIGYKGNYKKKCPKTIEALAKAFIEHCASYLVMPSCPSIVLEDSTVGESRDLNQLFAENFQVDSTDFEVKGRTFKLTHLKV
ncbi:MAG: ATP-binding protein [Planctomycetota bacterium]